MRRRVVWPPKHATRGWGPTTRGTGYGIGGALRRQEDVDKGRDGEDGATGLGMVDEVALAGLVFGVPFENVELRVIGALGRLLCVPCMSGIGGRVELFMGITV